MKFSLNFIKEFIDPGLTAQALAKRLTMAGMEVEQVTKQGSDWVFVVEVTTNRYDWLSMVGIAREIAAVLGKPFTLKLPAPAKEPRLTARKITIENPNDCLCYTGRLIGPVAVGSSPSWLSQRLLLCGMASINDIVDITNYCMLKWGNPLHAFDHDKLQGAISIRRARPGEQFIGIDAKERTLSRDNLVIADEVKVIALAGVMGARNSEVDATTKNIFLEGAVFSPLAVRRSRRACGLDTESSYRFERRVSPRYLDHACQEASRLITALSGGTVQGLGRAGKPTANKPSVITISFSELNAYLGSKATKAEVAGILRNLGCQLKPRAKEKLDVLAPAERFDIQSKVDVYEEFARIRGFDAIPSQVPSLAHCLTGVLAKAPGRQSYLLKDELRNFFALLGFKEIITYSLQEQEDLRKLSGAPIISVLNPLRSQGNALRPTLLLGMAAAVRHNLNRGQSGLRFFEIADVYEKHGAGFVERSALAAGICAPEEEFFYLKGALKEALNRLAIAQVSFCEHTNDIFSSCLSVRSGTAVLGIAGAVNKSLLKQFDIKDSLLFAELNLELLAQKQGNRFYRPLSPFPGLWRDISIVLSRRVLFSTLEKIIKEKSKYLTEVRVVDTYRGKDVPVEATAFTLRLFYQSREKTLVCDEVDSFHHGIRDILAQTTGVRLR